MPLYDYRCRECGHVFEELVRSRPGPSLITCAKCGQLTAIRQLSTFAATMRGRSAGADCGPTGG
jgi:putative FmdB family regulatory protein